ncbi:MAG: S49 family peptidase [Verrucomicrobiota bacterium]|nr:S49 family peptidase [Verrucomicrobiota bacterium]
MEIARESIFVSALRSFCKVFFSIIGFFLALFLISFIYSLFSSPYNAEEKTSLTLLPDLNGKSELRPISSPAILQINIHGVIGEPEKLDTDVVQSILLDSQNNLLLKNRIKAILLHVNTPGGTVTDSDNIYRMLKEYKQKYNVPIFAYVDGMCASGGMYVTSAADKLYASPASVVGSVGVVFGPFFNVSDAMGRLGIQSKTITQGLDKDMMNPFRPWKPDEDAAIQAVMAFFYNRFVDIVTAAHPNLNKDKLISEYGAKIFDGPTAQRLGYIDVADADDQMALRDLMTEANIDPEKPYQIVTLETKKDWYSSLMGSGSSLFTGKLEHIINFGDQRSPAIRDQFSYLFEPGISHE